MLEISSMVFFIQTPEIILPCGLDIVYNLHDIDLPVACASVRLID